MNRLAGAAAQLPGETRKHLAVRALAGGLTIRALADGHGVSRKFVYQQKHKARAALDDAFTPAPEAAEPVLGTLPVTARWLRQVIVALTLSCRSSYRGVVEFVRDLLLCRDLYENRRREIFGVRQRQVSRVRREEMHCS
ncbi:hypothetical protein [Burkholderia sp. HI2714]|uniref:hypothetical protein n=1 Tax=Burkholderia sp. HI2714 TaxID=2015359 RepID=UPI00117FD6C3|nr:hypothetical protein [Burkholderia sp. HI2714]